MRRLLIWLLMICKRLYKKPGFIVIFVSLILMTGAMVVFQSNDVGIVTVALFAEDAEEAATAEIISSLTEKESLIRFIRADSEEEARGAVASGRADIAWLFPRDLGERLERFSEDRQAAVTAVIREDNIYAMLASEKLYTVLYPRMSFGLFGSFIGNRLGEADVDILSEYYEESRFTGELIGLEFSNSEDEVSSGGYLMSPLRGLLGLAVSLTSLASVMYFFTDRDRGVFSWIPVRRQIFVQLGYVLVPTAWAGLFVLIALRVGGLFTSFPAEAGMLLLYCLMCTVFSVLIGRLADSVLRLGTVIPTVMLAELALSPVLINLPSLAALSRIFPLYHYLTAIYAPAAAVHMIIYIALGGALCILTRKRA